jgi:hypothetical protein
MTAFVLTLTLLAQVVLLVPVEPTTAADPAVRGPATVLDDGTPPPPPTGP